MFETPNIINFDSKIKEKFQKEYINLPLYKKKLKELEKTAENDKILYRSRTELEKNIEHIKNNIRKIESKEELYFYIFESHEYIEEYKKILKTPMKAQFTGKNTVNNVKKNEILTKYIQIMQKYCDINVKLPEKKVSVICENCNNKRDFIIEENSRICPECGTQQELLQYTSSYKDIDRVNISSKYTYDRKVHFRDCINQYQGKQNCTIDQKVYDDLEDIFERHHLLVGDKNTVRSERFKNITKEHILMFLKELKYSKHYENVTLIYYNLTGQKPDDISDLEEKLLNDFDLLVETYDTYFKNKVDRVNFISTQYVLYQLLQRHKHKCKKEDFVILKTTDRKAFHDNICRELFSRLGWNFFPTIG